MRGGLFVLFCCCGGSLVFSKKEGQSARWPDAGVVVHCFTLTWVQLGLRPEKEEEGVGLSASELFFLR